MGVEVGKDLLGGETLRSLQAADEDAVGLLKILHGGALSQELGVGEDLELDAGPGVRLENRSHALGRLAGHGGLLHNNLGGLGDISNRAGGPLDPLEVSSLAGTETRDLGRGVHGHEDDIRLPDGSLNLGREEEVLAAAL